ncbi:MAG: TetR/AcrR family transcriptional regulator [Clostridia bacterium]
MNQSQRKLKRLMEKAEELFWRYGYRAVSMDLIAVEAGISKMTMYKHFPSKDDLFIEILKNYTIRHIDKIMVEINQKRHVLEKIEYLYAYSLGLSKDMPPSLIKDIMERSYVMENLVSFKREKALAIWQHILEDGIQKGEIRPIDVEFASSILMDLPTLFIKSEDLSDEKAREKLYKNFFDFIKYGLLGGIESP